MSRETFAAKLGYSVSTVEKIEAGYRVPKLPVLLEIAEVLDCKFTGEKFVTNAEFAAKNEIPISEQPETKLVCAIEKCAEAINKLNQNITG